MNYPIPTVVKILNGNPGKQKLNLNEPKPAEGKPKAPAHLSKGAKAHWARTMKVMWPTGVITLAESDLLSTYCEAVARWLEAKTEIRAKGMLLVSAHGGPIRNPLLKVLDDAERTMLRCQSELGMTPSARARLSVSNQVGDALDQFLNGE